MTSPFTTERHRNFDFYLGYLGGTSERNVPDIERTDRVVIRVLDRRANPVAGAQAQVSVSGATLFEAPTGGEGTLFFFPAWAGVGGSHLEPTLPCYFVTLLSEAIVRMLTIEVSGDYEEPAADDVIRTGGDPTDGACVLSDGEQVLVF